MNSSLTSSKDVFNDILTPLNKRNRFINGKSPIAPIYFYRYIGFSNKQDYYKKINTLNQNLKSFKNLYTHVFK
ncbi:YceG family protein [Clostridium novyi]|uniref:YceG family protein n=1 Tax=Clostridium novyi TaxID=1542 RepID=UPI0030B8D42B